MWLSCDRFCGAFPFISVIWRLLGSNLIPVNKLMSLVLSSANRQIYAVINFAEPAKVYITLKLDALNVAKFFSQHYQLNIFKRKDSKSLV